MPSTSASTTTPTAVTTSVRRRRSARSCSSADRGGPGRRGLRLGPPGGGGLLPGHRRCLVSRVVPVAAAAGEQPVVERPSGVRGRHTSQPLSASRPTSRAISQGYFAAAFCAGPAPPPKQPHSIDSPRAHAEQMPTTNATSSSADTTAATRVSRPSSRQQPDQDLQHRQRVAHDAARPPPAAAGRRARPGRSRPGRAASGAPATTQTPPTTSRASSPTKAPARRMRLTLGRLSESTLSRVRT